MKWLLIDPEEEFSHKFISKLQETNDIDYFNNSKMVEKDDLEKYSKVIISDKVRSKTLRNLENVIILTENLEKDSDNYVYKFQPYRELIERIELYKIEDNQNQNSDKKIILLYFLTEKVDKMQVITRTLNKIGKEHKIFYLNLETISNIDDYIAYDRKYPSIINAFYNKDYKDIIYKLSDNLHMFYPTDNAMEMINISFEKIEELIHLLIKDGYDYVFLDIDTKFDLETIKYFQVSDMILLFTETFTKKYERMIGTLKSIIASKDMSEKICRLQIGGKTDKIYEKIKEQLKAK